MGFAIFDVCSGDRTFWRAGMARASFGIAELLVFLFVAIFFVMAALFSLDPSPVGRAVVVGNAMSDGRCMARVQIENCQCGLYLPELLESRGLFGLATKGPALCFLTTANKSPGCATPSNAAEKLWASRN